MHYLIVRLCVCVCVMNESFVHSPSPSRLYRSALMRMFLSALPIGQKVGGVPHVAAVTRDTDRGRRVTETHQLLT